MNEMNVLEMKNIMKEFNSVYVLDNVDFELRKGEVHAIVGANGAGKSTLMKILNGIFIRYEGSIYLNGEEVFFKSPRQAFEHGVAMIHQELDLVPNLDVSENIFLGRERCNANGTVIDRAKMRREAQELLNSLDFDIRSDEMIEKLPPAKQQLVLIARIVASNAQVVVMDEPTSSLSINEIEKLFKVICDLCNKGISVIYISHFLEEIFRISNRVTVLRDGKKVVTKNTKECDTKQLVEWMIGHEAETGKKYIREEMSDEIILSVEELEQKHGIVKDASFEIKKGEVLGIAGVVGSGRTELVKMIYGAEEAKFGKVYLDGKELNTKTPVNAVAAGIAFIPENRKTEGLVLNSSIEKNISLPALREKSRIGFLDHKRLNASVDKMIGYLKIKCSSKEQEVRFLSGGNQQKIVIGKWLAMDSRIIIMDQPTRGVDVGAKDEIYRLINTLAEDGTTIILVSDEMEEILNMSDRILVMKKGRIICQLDNSQKDISKADLLTCMVGEQDTIGQVII